MGGTEPSGAAPVGAAAPSQRGAGVIAPPPRRDLGGLAIGFVLQALLGDTPVGEAVRWPLGTALAVAGFVLARGFFRAFHRAGTPVSPYAQPSALVTRGPYRLTRNPGYLGMALAYCGIAVLAASLWALLPLALVLVAIDRGVIAREERYLEDLFGEQYLRYKQRTRRWL